MPDEYSRTAGDPYEAKVDEKTFRQLNAAKKHLKNGLRFFDNNYPGSGGENGWVHLPRGVQAKPTLGQNYIRLVLHRAGMMGDERAKEAAIEIDSLVKVASDGDLEEAARSIAQNAAASGSDYTSEYESSLSHLKTERKKLNSRRTKTCKQK